MAASPGPIRLELPVPFPIATANAWLWGGAGGLLVDCGTSSEASVATITAAVTQTGGGLAGLRLALTHGHIDHAGNAAALAARGVQVCAMAAESPFIETFRRDAETRNGRYRDALVAHGMPPGLADAARERGQRVDRHTHDTPLAVAWRGGERVGLDASGRAGEAVVVAAPGHTAGSLLLALDGNDLVTGDTLLEHITSNAIELLDEDHGRYAQYLRTLDGLRRYVGCRALPGHGPAFAVTDALLDHHMAKHLRRREGVLAGLRQAPPGAVGLTAHELLPAVLPHLAEDQSFLGMCEVVGHLHALEAMGRVRKADGARPRRFTI